MNLSNVFRLIWWLLAVPFCVGLLPLPLLKRRLRTPGVALVLGYILLFTILELVGIPVVLFNVYHGFTIFIKWFTPVILICAFGGVLVSILRVKKGYELNFQGAARWQKTMPEEKILLVLFLLLVGFQLYMAFTRASFDGDDAYYGAQALIAQQMDTLYRVNPYTGRSSPLDVRHVLALFPLWEAYIGSMSGVHVTILCHSIIPLALIVLTYVLYYQTGRILLKKNPRQLPMFMILIALWQMFGAVSIYTAETFFLTRTWQGKSFAGNFVIPAVLWLFLCLFEQDGEQQWSLNLKEGWKVRESGKGIVRHRQEEGNGQAGLWLVLSCVNLAGGASSSLAILLSCLMSMGFGFLFALYERKISILIKTGLCCVPGAAYVLLYLLLTHGILVF